jgi:Tol biopolymer transport system component
MTNTRVLSVMHFTIICLLFMSTISFSQQTASQLFEKALYIEEARGELHEAIDLYQQILNQYPEDRSVAAKALLHTGLCYEKLGYSEAQKAYQQLVNKFPDQEQEVVIARERLSRLKQIAEEVAPISPIPKFTKIKIPTKLSWCVKLSPDGKNLALESDNKLWTMPLEGNLGPGISGTPVQFNTENIKVEEYGLSWSANGKWIAFNEYPKTLDSLTNQGIFMVSSAGGTTKKIFENYRDARVVNYQISLSPDGKKLAFTTVKENKQHIYTMDTENGDPQLLVEMEAREPVFSPNGKMIAFVQDKFAGRHEGDMGLWIISANGGIPQKMADAGFATSPVWSPDGSMIAFLDGTREGQVFIVPINIKGQAKQQHVTIDVPERTEGFSLLAGWTPENKIGALLATKQEMSLYTVPAEGGQAAIILHDTHALQPRWSKDGKRIFYVTSPEEGENRMLRLGLATVPANGGEGKSIPVKSNRLPVNQRGAQSGNRISPDGKWIISAAFTDEDLSEEPMRIMFKIWKIAIDGSEAIQLTNTQGPYADKCPSWSPDGKKVAFLRGLYGIYVIDSSGGEPELLVAESRTYANSLIWSPNGKMLAWLSQGKEDPKNKPRLLNVFDFSTRKSRVAGEVPSQHVNIETAWSPDSKRIAFNDKEGKVIKIMNLADGSIEDIETGLEDVTIHHLDWSPDGKKFVFGGIKGGKKEFWLMEDFLPLVKND